ncbi:MAG: aldehyde dehydrogenase [Spirochaetales bacterium]|nr:aldehyde dehydrogenase [Spirochaetales bacterium]
MTDPAKIMQVIEDQRTFFKEGHTRNLKTRVMYLKGFLREISLREKDIMKALQADLGKSDGEAYMTEISLVREEIRYFIKNTYKLSRTKRVKTPLAHFPSASRIEYHPYGGVLLISPWNYPFQLTFAPLVGAVAAGNTVIIKPSEDSPATTQVMKEIVESCFPPELVALFDGDVEVSRTLLEEKFDFIFFTGSTGVGKIIMEKAAAHLTPVCLELGGKSPCIVDETARIETAARRIAWGKFLNAGQTCVAPDYVVAHESIVEELLEALKRNMALFYTEKAEHYADYPKIINQRHFDRLSELLSQSKIYAGGERQVEEQKISPTLLYPVQGDEPIMAGEIFGPLLPIMTYKTREEAEEIVHRHPTPLALYLFSESKSFQTELLSNLSFGGGCINDVVVHLANANLPFGGIGQSGMGSYHGKKSFQTFSHERALLKKSALIDTPFRYHRYPNQLKILKKVMG